MGQSSISMLNKVGHSMFWNSMWDNKVLYSRYLKEDNFLNKFFSLAFNDSLSVNTINFKQKFVKNSKKLEHITDKKKTSMYKYLFNFNKINYFSSKLWILKYHNWIVLYHFIYILNSNKNLDNFLKNFNDYNYNFYYLLKSYNKSNYRLKYSLNSKLSYSKYKII